MTERPSLVRGLQRVVDVRDDEVRALFVATLYGFCIFLSYYILRPVRDEISSADRGNLQVIWTAVFFVMLIAVPAYSWLTSRYGRRIFVPVANRFFILNLVAFYAALYLLPESARPWIDRVFYVWGSVFALFVVTVFWGFLVDVFSNQQGRRLFAFITVGASLGGIAGSAVSAFLVQAVGIFALLLMACVPLEIGSWCATWLHRADQERRFERTELDSPLPGTAFSGMRTVFRNPYLATIAAYIGLMTFASTVLYFQQAHLVGEAITDRAARASFYAQIDLAVNVLTIVLQVALTARILRWLGVALSLMLIPAITVIGFIGLGVVPLLAVLVGLQILYRAGRYGIAKPVREVLFTVVGREERYKSKAFLDAAIYRGGDLVSGWIYAGLAAVGLSVGAIALVAAPLAAVWVGTGLVLGRRHDLLAASDDD